MLETPPHVHIRAHIHMTSRKEGTLAKVILVLDVQHIGCVLSMNKSLLNDIVHVPSQRAHGMVHVHIVDLYGDLQE